MRDTCFSTEDTELFLYQYHQKLAESMESQKIAQASANKMKEDKVKQKGANEVLKREKESLLQENSFLRDNVKKHLARIETLEVSCP
jgi:cell division protein FtsB